MLLTTSNLPTFQVLTKTMNDLHPRKKPSGKALQYTLPFGLEESHNGQEDTLHKHGEPAQIFRLKDALVF